MDAIVDRLARNARKQREYRTFMLYMGKAGSKRSADAYFLHKYAGLTHQKIADLFSVSRGRVGQMIRCRTEQEFSVTVCHPRGTCR